MLSTLTPTYFKWLIFMFLGTSVNQNSISYVNVPDFKAKPTDIKSFCLLYLCLSFQFHSQPSDYSITKLNPKAQANFPEKKTLGPHWNESPHCQTSPRACEGTTVHSSSHINSIILEHGQLRYDKKDREKKREIEKNRWEKSIIHLFLQNKGTAWVGFSNAMWKVSEYIKYGFTQGSCEKPPMFLWLLDTHSVLFYLFIFYSDGYLKI